MNNSLSIYRLIRQPSETAGTLGEMLNPDGSHLCFSCELPWRDNKPNESCIPMGTYTCVPHNSGAHPNTWELQNVPGREDILIHNGNAAEVDSKGCILVGNEFGTINGFPAVLNSVATLNMLRSVLPSSFSLVVDGPADA
jgi:hypothetical protein